MDEIKAKKILDSMSLEDCIAMFNEVANANGFYHSTIHEVDDDSWWNELFRRRKDNCYGLVRDLLDSKDSFNHTDMYFHYDEEGMVFSSFNTKEELLKYISEDFYIEEIYNMN